MYARAPSQACIRVAAERATCVHVFVVESVVALYVCVCSESVFLEYARLVASCAEMCIIGICSNAKTVFSLHLLPFLAFALALSLHMSMNVAMRMCIGMYAHPHYKYVHVIFKG